MPRHLFACLQWDAVHQPDDVLVLHTFYDCLNNFLGEVFDVQFSEKDIFIFLFSVRFKDFLFSRLSVTKFRPKKLATFLRGEQAFPSWA